MKVKDLIHKLSYCDGELEVKIGYDYGDYFHTTVFETPENVDILKVAYSDRYYRHELVTEDEDSQDSTECVCLHAQYLEEVY